MPFGTGFITGLAKSIDRNLQEDMALLKEETSHLSKLRFQRGQREHERYTEEMRTNLDTIKDMSKKVGGADSVQYLIDTYGYEEAQTRVNDLVARQKQSGGMFKIADHLKLEKRAGNSVTARQLAEFVTTPYSLSKQTDFGQEAPGLMKLFGVDRGVLGAEIKTRSDKMLTAAGIPTDMKTSLDMPETLKGRGIREWELYQPANPADAHKYLYKIAVSKMEEATSTGNAELEAEAFEVMAAANLEQEAANVSKRAGKPMTPAEAAKSSALMSAYLASIHGVAKKGQYQNDTYTNAGMEIEQFRAITAAGDTIDLVANQALAAGVDPVVVAAARRRAGRENRILIFNPVDEKMRGFVKGGGTLSFGEEDSLLDRSLFPASPLNNPPPPNPGQSSSSSQAIQPNVSSILSNNKAAYKTGNATQKNDIVQKLTGIINPATGVNFTTQEARDYLES